MGVHKTVGLGKPFIVGHLTLDGNIQIQIDQEQEITGFATIKEAESEMYKLATINGFQIIDNKRARGWDGSQLLVFSILDYHPEVMLVQ